VSLAGLMFCELNFNAPKDNAAARDQGGGGKERAGGRRAGLRLWGYGIFGLAAELQSVCKRLFVRADEVG
jgi:hypothetical protein